MSLSNISWRANAKHFALEKAIKELDTNQDITRTGITERSISCGILVENWVTVVETLRAYNEFSEKPLQNNFQIKLSEVNKENLKIITKKITAQLGITKIHTQYLMQILWANYLLFLKSKVKSVAAAYNNTTDLRIPEMFRILAEIVMLNRESDQETIKIIKNALIEWENQESMKNAGIINID
jgi:hypothetical protein